ncbi:amidohydrolase [Idiomarina tyrosinivorans]|uniref:Amidohydrolase n=1 Tax=Idiomarina tyrosinivorans TaxID=1445662 RepID=A0A432ZLM5_9GAMM|nr:amidohydrolase family protein [Idiomarina tyrosinivorans]RUO78876.1 amidohydrolase [Idiomarina tyrosinivorans]
MKSWKHLFSGLVLALAASTASAHDQVPGEKQQHPILLKGGTLHTVTQGVMVNTDLLFSGGEIIAMGNQLTLPDNTEVIDIQGQHVYPGLIAMDTTLGLNEIEAVRATRDSEEVGAIHPEVTAHVAFNADSEVIPTVRYNGVAYAQVVPQGQLVMGASSLMQLDGWNADDAIVRAKTGMHVQWPRTYVVDAWWEQRTPEQQREANAKALDTLKQVFVDAKAYYDAKQADQLNAVDVRWEAMLGLFDGSLPLYVHANDVRQLEQALDIAKEYGFQLVLVGAADAWRIKERLAKSQTPVIFEGLFGLPNHNDDGYDQAYRSAGELAAAGVNLALAYPGYWDTRNLAFGVGNAIAYGLNPDKALAMVTLKPAKLLGVGAQLGSLTVGKKASLIVSKGDIFDPLGQDLSAMFINGRKVTLQSRQTELYHKYQKRPE